MMGIGFALYEQYFFDKSGKMLNSNFGYYKIPTIFEMPKLKNIIINSYESTGPYGAKSVGEVAVNGPAPAIANAVYNAIGIRIRDIPITPEKIINKCLTAT